MREYILILTLIGLAAMGMAWMPAISKKTGISYAIFYVAAGAVIYGVFGAYLPDPLPRHNNTLTLHLTELVIIISLMGTGIKIGRTFSLKNWASPLKMVSIGMLLCIGATLLAGYQFLGLSLASAMLLGGVLAPSDPVLASDVQVGPPSSTVKSETKFTLTAEAGMNDGMAFPFIWLAIFMALRTQGSEFSIWQWLAYDVGYKIAVGLLIGFIVGRLVGSLLFQMPRKFPSLKTHDGLSAIALTLFVYGLTEIIHGYGFIAVFVSAVSLRHFEKGHDLHHELHSTTDQIERLMVAVVLLLFGGTLVTGILVPLTWPMVICSLGYLLLIRPLAGVISLLASGVPVKERLAISFFGIRGIGSIFYLAFAFAEFKSFPEDELWAIVAFTITSSVLIHGITAAPAMRYLKRHTRSRDTRNSPYNAPD